MKHFFLVALLWAFGSLVCSAQLVFESKAATVKAGIDDKQVFAYYAFENKGAKPITITKVKSPCSYCLTGAASGGTRVGEGNNAKFVYQPGEKGKIRATFTMGTFTGTVEKEVHLYQEGDVEGKPSIKLSCKVIIPKHIHLSPKSLSWKKDELGVTKKMILEVKTPKPLVVYAPSCSSESFQLKFVELEKGRKYELQVTPMKDADKTIAICYFKTASSHVKYRRIRYYLKIK